MSIDTHHDVEISPCRVCESPVFDDELFCEACGARLVESAAEALAAVQRASDREELDLGSVAAISDRGLRRHRNEDAMAVATAGGRSVAIVCDGVASTANPDLAAHAAAEEALRCLEPLLHSPDPLDSAEVAELLREAFANAQQAVMRVPDDEPDGNDLSPSTTMVAAVVSPELIVVGNVGDSRAYWLSQAECRLLTTDDSWAQDAIAEGMAPALAYAHPDSHAITRWVGADTETPDPTLQVLPVTGPGVVLACTDGLWNYFEDAEELNDLILHDGTPFPAPIETARRLTDAALTAGGQDNVTVAIVPVDPNRTFPNGPNGKQVGNG
jgi:serine/threonine protein phosphatase PrpC